MIGIYAETGLNGTQIALPQIITAFARIDRAFMDG